MNQFCRQSRSQSVSDRRIEAILYYLESRGLTKQALESSMGNQDKVTAILDRKSPLTLEIIRQLHHQLGIPAQVLIQPYSLAS
jgi:HTH-type transcriptional regulator / antitoxin HigA